MHEHVMHASYEFSRKVGDTELPKTIIVRTACCQEKHWLSDAVLSIWGLKKMLGSLAWHEMDNFLMPASIVLCYVAPK
jgi:hypothetical protein